MKSSRVSRLQDFTGRVVNGISILAIIVLALLMVIDILLRRVFNSPLAFSFELIQVGMVFAVFGSITYSSIVDQHVSIDILIPKNKKGARIFFDILAQGVSALHFALICWQSVAQGAHTRNLGTVTGILEIPVYPLHFVISFCCLIVFLLFAGALLRSFAGLGGRS